MARAKRHYLPGYAWHLTHRCHKGEFLLRFGRDRRRWMEWLFEAKKRYGLCILNYMATSNHILLVIKLGEPSVRYWKPVARSFANRSASDKGALL